MNNIDKLILIRNHSYHSYKDFCKVDIISDYEHQNFYYTWNLITDSFKYNEHYNFI